MYPRSRRTLFAAGRFSRRRGSYTSVNVRAQQSAESLTECVIQVRAVVRGRGTPFPSLVSLVEVATRRLAMVGWPAEIVTVACGIVFTVQAARANAGRAA